jgi:hypothetical protein
MDVGMKIIRFSGVLTLILAAVGVDGTAVAQNAAPRHVIRQKVKLVHQTTRSEAEEVPSPTETSPTESWELAVDDIDLSRQSAAVAAAKSQGCIACHKDACDPHAQPGRPLAIQLGCVDCHGGNSAAVDKAAAHVQPQFPDVWHSSANPVRSYTLLNYECPEFIRFVNPGDLRIAHLSCGTTGCHPRETLEVRKSMMTHGCMLWGSALYNNGAVPNKWPRYGESYGTNGTPQRLVTVPPPTPEETARKGILPFLDPLPRFENSQPGNVLRIFERGGRFRKPWK